MSGYTDLLALIQSTTQNTETAFVASIPTFIKLAERQIFSTVDTPAMRVVTTATITASSRDVPMPSGFIACKSVSIKPTTGGTADVLLIPKTYSYLKEMYNTVASVGVPKYYAMGSATATTTSLYIAPTPNAAYTATVEYTAFPLPLSGTTVETWLNTNFPMVLQYGALLHAYVFMKGSADVMAYYKGAYDLALSDMTAALGKGAADGFRS